MSFFSKFYNRIYNHEHVLFRWEKTEDLLKVTLPKEYRIESLNNCNNSDIEEWNKIISHSFNRSSNKDQFSKSITNHNRYEVLHTYKLMHEEDVVGVVSAALIKANPAIGATHSLGLLKSHRGRGLGKYLILHTMKYFEENKVKIQAIEGESRLAHKKSLFIHFDLGFRPKFNQDAWNVESYEGLLGLATRFVFWIYYMQWMIKNKRRK